MQGNDPDRVKRAVYEAAGLELAAVSSHAIARNLGFVPDFAHFVGMVAISLWFAALFTLIWGFALWADPRDFDVRRTGA
ncbi:hypothetical protein [Haloprofundus halobius]|uniref:hypothetical protein n=1 Tax=Haloprofundus halobius TaxID=2876194 RepID=UPI001CC97FEA|nr:hypothetical protein [Haloprofundus halobius]